MVTNRKNQKILILFVGCNFLKGKHLRLHRESISHAKNHRFDSTSAFRPHPFTKVGMRKGVSSGRAELEPKLAAKL
jgi:hypothetical protein